MTLAEAAGISFEPKPLRIVDRAVERTGRRGTLHAFDDASRAMLTPPWPDVVVAAGRWSAHAALWIRAQSGGSTRLVHIGRPWAPLQWFDLVVTTAQYGLPPRSNVLCNAFPLTAPRPNVPLPPELEKLPRPRLLLILGGDSPPRVLDAADARAMALEASARAERERGSLLVATSPRTPGTAVEALQSSLAVSPVATRLSVFGDDPNLYGAFLAAADAVVVTDDSAAMIAEAAMTGAPVTIRPLPQRPRAKRARVARLRALAALTPPTRALFDMLIERGIVTSDRDLDRYRKRLEAEGLLRGGDAARARAASELAEAARRLRTLAAVDGSA